MSSQTKDPLQKQDTTSDSSESPSDGEVGKAEETLEHLKIEERVAKKETKGDTEESKPFDSPNQEGTSKDYLLNEPIAGPSGLQEPNLARSDDITNPESKEVVLSDPNKEKVEAKETSENIGDKMAEGDSDTTDNAPPFIHSSTGLSFPVPARRAPVVGPNRPAGIVRKRTPLPNVLQRYGLAPLLQQSSSSKRFSFATDSANTSSDVSEIRSEVVDTSAEGSVYHDASENFEKEDSPSIYVPAVERQSSETSGTSISELQDESVPPPTPSISSASTSTPSGEQGYRGYLEMLQREADERGIPISTSSGIGSTNQSELVHLQNWGLVGEMGHYRHNVDVISDSSNREGPEYGAQGEAQPASGFMQDEQIVERQRMVDFDGLFQQERPNEENMEESNMPEDVRIEASNVGVGSPLDRKSSKHSSGSTSAESVAGRLRPRHKPSLGKKIKVVTSKSSVSTQSSSESTEPKSSSSDEIHRKESPEIKSSSEAKESSLSANDRKPWQKPGQLRSLQLSTVPPKDSVITEEEGRISPQRDQNIELMETKQASPEMMETTPEKVAKTEPSVSQPSAPESSDQAYGSEADLTLKEHELSFEVAEFERSVGKSKRPDAKLSNSPPSEERLGSTPPKEATSRPKKKARADKKHGKGRRTRHDSGGSVPTGVGLDHLKQGDSTSTADSSDYTASDDERETSL